MLVGEYAITIEDEAGQSLAEIIQTATTGHPGIGNELVLNGRVFVVERIRHEQDVDTGSSSRVYSHARLFVRAVDRGGGRIDDADTEDEAVSGRVLPLVLPKRKQVSSIVLPPSLIAVVVACGYRAISFELRARHRRCARLHRGAYRWTIEKQNPVRSWELSRRAKRHYAELVAGMIDGRFGDEISDCGSPLGCELRSDAPASTSEAPIRLRLVVGG